MAIKLTNTSQLLETRRETSWWSWTAYIEVSKPDTLDDIDYVEYRLHPSFPNPIRRVKNPKGSFALTTKGWGVFPLIARVVFNDPDRKSIEVEHYLEFK